MAARLVTFGRKFDVGFVSAILSMSSWRRLAWRAKHCLFLESIHLLT
ncbi:hypothetical protein IVB15_24315 [Bradyrhizobium sp. 182]|nr:hypothetical protein [Bradyrhizobium sp. 182]MCK1530759.1 hypothetical protein [Bradyrhizobium sp. 182]